MRSGVGIAFAVTVASLSGYVQAGQGSEAQTQSNYADQIRAYVSSVCPLSDASGLMLQAELPGAFLLSEEAVPNASNPARINYVFALPDQIELHLERRQAGGVLRQFRASLLRDKGDTKLPLIQAMADGSCQIRSGQLIRYEDEAERFIDQLDADLETVRWSDNLQLPWPEGEPREGVRVALVDTGLAYDLELFRDRLARDQQGNPLGYDFWDMDAWPYDGDTGRSPFFPIRHGTAVASVVAQEAPEALLIPYRFPRPDMSRMGALVDRAVEEGAHIIAMPLGSNRPDDWNEFIEAVERNDILAIVSAGNDGRDVDQRPVYPAALDSDNLLTVTSSDGFGRLAQGSNWGGQSIDLMLPAENVSVVDFRGSNGSASGSSYAVPRLAALAARILDKHPELDAQELKTRILALATNSPYEQADRLAVGWLPDPLTNDF